MHCQIHQKLYIAHLSPWQIQASFSLRSVHTKLFSLSHFLSHMHKLSLQISPQLYTFCHKSLKPSVTHLWLMSLITVCHTSLTPVSHHLLSHILKICLLSPSVTHIWNSSLITVAHSVTHLSDLSLVTYLADLSLITFTHSVTNLKDLSLITFTHSVTHLKRPVSRHLHTLCYTTLTCLSSPSYILPHTISCTKKPQKDTESHKNMYTCMTNICTSRPFCAANKWTKTTWTMLYWFWENEIRCVHTPAVC